MILSRVVFSSKNLLASLIAIFAAFSIGKQYAPVLIDGNAMLSILYDSTNAKQLR